DERMPRRLRAAFLARRLRRPAKIPLGAIGIERHGSARRTSGALALRRRPGSGFRGALARGLGASDDMERRLLALAGGGRRFLAHRRSARRRTLAETLLQQVGEVD